MFQWPDEEDEGSGYASFGTISSVQTRFVSVSLVDNSDANLYRRREAQEKTTKAQQESFDNIQYLLEQLRPIKNRKWRPLVVSWGGENLNEDIPKDEQTFSIDVRVIKSI